MFRRKAYQNCPKCFSPINPKNVSKDVGICYLCGWAGSQQSEKYESWIQFKNSVVIALVGVVMFLGVVKLGELSPDYQLHPTVSKWLTKTVELKNQLLPKGPKS